MILSITCEFFYMPSYLQLKSEISLHTIFLSYYLNWPYKLDKIVENSTMGGQGIQIINEVGALTYF